MFFAAPQGFLFSPFTPSRWLSQLTVVQEHFFLPHYPIAATNVSLPAAYCASPVQPSSVIIALPSSATLLKSTHFPLIPNPPNHLSCFIPFTCHTTSSHDLLFPNLFNTDGVNDEIKWEGQKLLIHFLFFFLPLFLREKIQTHFKGLNMAETTMEGTICSSSEGGRTRVQAKANCLSSIVKRKKNSVNCLPFCMQGFGKPVLAAVLPSKLKCKDVCPVRNWKSRAAKRMRGLREERFKRVTMNTTGLKHMCKRKGTAIFLSIFEGPAHQGELPPPEERMQLETVDEITRWI